MALHFTLQRVVVADSHEQVSVDELIVLTKDTSNWSTWG